MSSMDEISSSSALSLSTFLTRIGSGATESSMKLAILIPMALEILNSTRVSIGKPDLGAKGLFPDYIDAAAQAGAGNNEGMHHETIEI